MLFEVRRRPVASLAGGKAWVNLVHTLHLARTTRSQGWDRASCSAPGRLGERNPRRTQGTEYLTAIFHASREPMLSLDESGDRLAASTLVEFGAF